MSDSEAPLENQVAVKEVKDDSFYPHIKTEINFHVICDHSVYKDMKALHPMIANFFTFNPSLGLFDPILYISDFWHL